MDDLIARVRERVADPKRRTDAPQAISLSGPGGTMTTQFSTIGGLLMGRGGSSTNPNVAELPPPASSATLDAAEAGLGAPIPDELRRLYVEVADGGFGPGGGLLGIERAVAAWRDLRAEPYLPNGPAWPAALLPIVDQDPGYDCVDLTSGSIVAWDPEGLTERSGAKAWQRAFSETAPSVEAWIRQWVESRPAHEVLQERLNISMVEEARKARALIGAKTPEERRAMGLPDVGWEKVVWGGIGLEDEST